MIHSTNFMDNFNKSPNECSSCEQLSKQLGAVNAVNGPISEEDDIVPKGNLLYMHD